jgi:hypothetical protein
MVQDIISVCSKCPKDVHCCRFDDSNGFVFVGIDAAKKISKNLNLKYKDFLEFKPFSKKTVSLLKKSQRYSEGFMRLKQIRKNKLLVLKIKKNKDCIFFDNENLMIRL